MRKKINQKGQILIFALVFMLIITSLVAALVGYASLQIRAHRQAMHRVTALNIAEAGAEMAIWKLNNQLGYAGETDTPYGNGEYSVTISSLGGTSRLIRVDSYVPNSATPLAQRTIQVTATMGTTNIGFNYGVQLGNGGLEMTNSSRVIGNVYANSNIVGSNSARIEGTAIVAGATGIIDGVDIDGNSWSHTIRGNSTVGGNALHAVLQNTSVTGNVTSNSISNCSIGGNATYDTRTSCSVTGTATTPNPNDFVPAEQIPLPITAEQIDNWESEAEAGGTIPSQTFNSGTRSLGPVKINGNLALTNTAVLVVTGTIWVTGSITLSQSAVLRLAPEYGNLSGLVMAGVEGSTTAGYIETGQSTQALGSGTAGSYIMLLSQRVGIVNPAISTSQSSGSTILYAGEGLIEVHQTAALKEITAQKLILRNSATITYEAGLANSNFASGPGGGWEIQDQSWQLLR